MIHATLCCSRHSASLVTREDVRLYWLYHSKRWFSLYITACLVHLALSVFESPCSVCWRGGIALDGLHATGGAAQVTVVSVIEVLCLLVYATDLLISRRLYGPKMFKKQKWETTRLVCLLAMAVDLAVYLLSGLKTVRCVDAVR